MSIRIGYAGLLVIGTALSGCVQGPSYPLMTPLGVAQTFGYDEKPLGGPRYDVVYVAPAAVTPGFHYIESPAESGQKNVAFDLASYRAAQLAQQNNYRGFDIVEQHASTDEQSYGPDYWDDGWYGGLGWRSRHYGWGGGYGFHHWDNNLPEHRVQVEVKLTITLVNDVKPGQYDAASVISQIHSHYPNVDGPTVAPGTLKPVAPPINNGTVQPSGSPIQPSSIRPVPAA